jgi:hypothetical protein
MTRKNFWKKFGMWVTLPTAVCSIVTGVGLFLDQQSTTTFVVTASVALFGFGYQSLTFAFMLFNDDSVWISADKIDEAITKTSLERANLNKVAKRYQAGIKKVDDIINKGVLSYLKKEGLL